MRSGCRRGHALVVYVPSYRPQIPLDRMHFVSDHSVRCVQLRQGSMGKRLWLARRARRCVCCQAQNIDICLPETVWLPERAPHSRPMHHKQGNCPSYWSVSIRTQRAASIYFHDVSDAGPSAAPGSDDARHNLRICGDGQRCGCALQSLSWLMGACRLCCCCNCRRS